MASNDPPGDPAAPSNNPPPMDPSPPKYVPQFSAATEMILKRIQSGTSPVLSLANLASTPPGYEDMRRSVLQGMRTSMNMELPATPIGSNRGRGGRASTGGNASASRSRASATPTGSAGGASAKGKPSAKPKGRTGGKRKRAKEEEESSEEESESSMSKLGGDSESDDSEVEMTLPKITQSGRQVNKPTQFVPEAYATSTKRRAPSKRTQEQALCKRCGRGHSPQNNLIVFCDSCNLGWHQMCHDPQISEEAVKDEKSSWFCAECTRKREAKSQPASQPTKLMQPTPPIPGPMGAPTPSSGLEPVPGISWQGKTDGEKREYLSQLQQPQLVALLMSALAKHPNLPIFPNITAGFAPGAYQPVVPSARQSPAYQGRTNIHPQQPFPPSAISTANLFTRAEANPTAPINFIRKLQPGGGSMSPAVSTPPGTYQSFNQQQKFTPASAPPSNLPAAHADEDRSRESTPASPPYPRAGTGLMSKLGPDEEDLDWLVDSNDFNSFNHIIYGEHGEKVEENGVPVNGA